MNNRPPHQTAAAAGVSVFPFDASVDNFFAAIEEISVLCGSTPSSPTEIQRYSSMITFLKEWRYFQYKSRTVNFVYHKEAREPVRGVNLSQFSSVAVPMEQSPEKSTPDGKDFVLYAGGPVWALDWCPRSAESSGSDIKCEYLAVAAHPPGSAYHMIGKPLIGRGIIQIWCLVNIVEKDEKVENLALPTGRKSRGRPRKRPVEEEPLEMCDAEDTSYVPNKRPNVAIETHGISLVKPKKKPVSGSNGPARPRGRPRKHPLPDLTNLNGQEGLASRQQCINVDANVDVPLVVHTSNDKNAKEEPVVKKHRGRPRKYPLPDVSGNDESILGQDRVNVDVDVDVPLVILASNDKKVKEESAVKKPRGKPRKHPLLFLTNSSGQEESAPGQHCLNIASADDKGKEKWVVLKCCGSPRKNPIPNLNNSSPALSVELDKDTCTKLPAPGGHESTPLHAFTDLGGKGEIFRCRGKPGRKPIHDSDECVTTSSVKEDALELPNTTNSNNPSMKSLNADLAEDTLALLAVSNLNDKDDKSLPMKRGRPRKNPTPDVNQSVPTSGVALGADVSAVPSQEKLPEVIVEPSYKDKIFAVPSQEKQSGVTIEPSYKDKMFIREAKSSLEIREDALVLPGTKDSNNSSMNSSNADLPEAALVLTASTNLDDTDDKSLSEKRGRRRKNEIPIVNKFVPSYKDKMFLREAKSSVEIREDALVFPGTKDSNNSSMNSLNADLPEAALVLTASTNLDDTDDKSLSKKRGRRRKNEIPIVNKFVPSYKDKMFLREAKSSVEIREDALVFPGTKDSNNSSMNSLNADLPEAALVLTASTNLDDTDDKSLSEKRGRRRKNEIPIVNKFVPASDVEVELGVDVSAVPSQEKQLGVTVEPSYDNHYQNRMILCKEVMPSRVTNTNTTRLIVPPSIALPRVVLCLAHNGKVAWDVKWRPNTSESQQNMGYLAVLLGNGSLEVWDVPLPNTVKSLYASCCREGTDPRFMVLKPVFGCSKVKCGDKQSIPLTVEWSPSGSCDLIVAGCHDGTVALWKFSAHYPSQDTKPLLCFTADSVPIRALSWASEESDMESANVIVTAGHEGLKFWDLRDPYRPLWEFYPVQRAILSMDWLKEPRCIILSFDDGSLRTISLMKVVSDVPVTGKNSTVTKPPGVHSHQCSSFAIWSVQMSRATGLVAYCSADGTTLCFQLTTNAVEKEAHRNPQPHFLCSSLIEEGQTLNISTPLPSTPCFDIPPSARKSLRDYGDASRTVASNRSDAKEAQHVKSQSPALFGGNELTIVPGHGDSQTPPERKSTPTCSKTKKPKPNASSVGDQALLHGDQQHKVEVFPPKIMAMHRVRWNMNKGSERWLCYGGAAGIVRCQAIGLPRMP